MLWTKLVIYNFKNKINTEYININKINMEEDKNIHTYKKKFINIQTATENK